MFCMKTKCSNTDIVYCFLCESFYFTMISKQNEGSEEESSSCAFMLACSGDDVMKDITGAVTLQHELQVCGLHHQMSFHFAGDLIC